MSKPILLLVLFVGLVGAKSRSSGDTELGTPEQSVGNSNHLVVKSQTSTANRKITKFSGEARQTGLNSLVQIIATLIATLFQIPATTVTSVVSSFNSVLKNIFGVA